MKPARPTDLAVRVTAYLTEYLPRQRRVSQNTVKAYRDAFVLLLRYCRDERNLAPERLTLDHIGPKLVLDFLKFLEEKRKCKPRTINQRLAALRAFFRYVQTEEPDHIERCQQVLAIPRQRCAESVVRHIRPDDLAAILACPDLETRRGRRDAVLLSVLYDTGARVQELIDLSVRDVRLGSPAHVHLTGKGRKSRYVPLMKRTIGLLEEYMRENDLCQAECRSMPLFKNHRGERLTRSGVRYILCKYAELVRKERPSLPAQISPHIMRHSKGMHLIEANVPAIIVRDILGHVDLKTTSIYSRANIEMQRRALERTSQTAIPPTLPVWKTNPSLLDWLGSL